MDFRRVDVGMAPCWVGRLSYTGELGFEIWCDPSYTKYVFDALMAAGDEFGMRLFGMRALLSLRIEKMFGTWFREYRPIFNPKEAGIDRYVHLDHDFIGRPAYEAATVSKRLLYFEVEPDPERPADVIGDEPIWFTPSGGQPGVVGWVTSGDYGHCVGKSLALGYVDATVAGVTGGGDDAGRGDADAPGNFEIEIIGQRRPARLLTEPAFDPKGLRMRS
jgi:dimethylglycine dehydrogenase